MIFFFLKNQLSPKLNPIVANIIKKNEIFDSPKPKGMGTFIPKKLAITVGTMSNVVMIVSRLINIFKLFEIIEA